MTITENTRAYIKEHPYIEHCLKIGIINYSSLARIIAKELDMKDTASKDAILIAARRYADTLKKNNIDERKVLDYLSGSEMEIKNKMCMIIIKKPIKNTEIDEINSEIRNDKGIIYLTEGSDYYKIITQEKYHHKIKARYREKIIKYLEDLVMINMKIAQFDEKEVGIIAYITSLFAERGISIIDFISCWEDMYVVIESQHLKKTIEFIRF